MTSSFYVALIEPFGYSGLNIYSVATFNDEGQLCSAGIWGGKYSIALKFTLSLCRLLELGRSFSFLILYAVCRARWRDQPVARPLPTHRINTHRHLCLEWGSNTRSQCSSGEDCSCLRPRGHCDRLAFERAKTVHALDRAATVTG
jgi:hypothetical protein